MAKDLRGLESHQEQKQSQLIRDTRTIGQRLSDLVRNPTVMAVFLAMLAVSGFFMPGLIDVVFIFGLILFFVIITRRITLPFRMPQRANSLDYNDLAPGSGKPQKARGIYFFGNERGTNKELWFGNTDMRTHVLIFGSTGSGKTETLISIAYNALYQGSGFIYVDGKGDNALFSRVFAMVRYMGREDDLLLINFMTGAKDIMGAQYKRLSNTMNPFAVGSSSMLSQLVVSLMSSSKSGGGDGDMWKNRAISFVEALMRILVAMRDAGYILLDANTIRNYFGLDRLEKMVIDKVFVRDNEDPVKLDFLPDVVTEPMKSYVFNLPGFNPERKGKQVSQVWEQHGFITMQLIRTFSSLADTYGHIIRTNLAEVDLPDVVLNRRILVTLLPALEKSPDELANLGKVIIASLKSMMAAGLGEGVEGEYHDLIERKPTNAATPYLCILDEYGYYAVEGFAVVPAQARSLGFSVVFVGQDLPAFQKASKEEAASIGANTNIKICMKLEDPMETWEFFQKTAGESYVAQVESFQTDTQTVSGVYRDTKSARMEKRARVDLLDLKEQVEGDAHIFFKSNIIRARAFYANPKPVKKMRLNHLLKVAGPEDSFIDALKEGVDGIGHKLVQAEELFADTPVLDEELNLVVSGIKKDETISPIDRGVNGLMALDEVLDEVNEEAIEEAEIAKEIMEETQADKGFLDIFTNLQLPESLMQAMATSDFDKFQSALLSRDDSVRTAEYIARLGGQSSKSARDDAKKLVSDMAKSTFYPPAIHDLPDPSELIKTIDAISQKIEEASTSE